ncbi:MAG: hypothetical protein M3298_03355, partial [Thermoproteota archaeon]|nr:hypothetical protein [Thermoproteota archaeon]
CSTVMRLLGSGAAAGGVISGTANPLVELAGMGLVFTSKDYTAAARVWYSANGAVNAIEIERVVEGQGIKLSAGEREAGYGRLNIVVFGLTIAPGRQLGLEQNQTPLNKDQRLKDAKDIAKEKLRTHPECAKLLGKDKDPKKALDKALKALDKAQIEFEPLGGPTFYKGVGILINHSDARTDLKTKVITINTQGRFMAVDGALPVVNDPGQMAYGVNEGFYGLDNADLAAFILLHELGHVQNVLEDDSNHVRDQEGAEDRNNKKIYDDCFKELKQPQ